ncbi:MAG: hypothetical protein SGI77_05905 [Pirellulaceae bacterium]|nr:hypothetical protein [Pirellulaceae bacterium]
MTIALSDCLLGDVTNHSIEPELLIGRMRQWVPLTEIGSSCKRLQYVQEINRRYDALANCVSAEDLVELRLMRSLWAKKIAHRLISFVPALRADGLSQVCELLGSVRTLLHGEAVQNLLYRQKQIGDTQSNDALASLLAESALPEVARVGLQELGNSPEQLRLLGPERISKFRPGRKSVKFDPSFWLYKSNMTHVDFVNGNPDRIRIRGVELHSGDIGIVQLNIPGDGLLESFLEKPGIAPHAMLYVTRRIKDPKSKQMLFQPSVIEIYEGGWRSVPITTALHPKFSWYSEWVRPKLNGMDLGDDLGQKLSAEIDHMETFAFDFQARRAPQGGYFTDVFGGSCASCTNLVRIPFERAGIHGLPYPITKISPGAAKNLSILGMPDMDGIYTPTNILNDSGFGKVGIVDNGEPELAYAQALVVGRPELAETFGGWMSQKELVLQNLPNWRSVRHWRSAWETFRVRVGQSSGLLGRTVRKLLHVTAEEVPKSVSDTTIAFYLRSEMEAGHIIVNSVYPAVADLLGSSSELFSLSQLRANESLIESVRRGLLDSALKKENWYETLAIR